MYLDFSLASHIAFFPAFVTPHLALLYANSPSQFSDVDQWRPEGTDRLVSTVGSLVD